MLTNTFKDQHKTIYARAQRDVSEANKFANMTLNQAERSAALTADIALTTRDCVIDALENISKLPASVWPAEQTLAFSNDVLSKLEKSAATYSYSENELRIIKSCYENTKKDFAEHFEKMQSAQPQQALASGGYNRILSAG